jgi:hypothetical protein
VKSRTIAVLLLSIAALFVVACEKPDASDVTSPSVRALIGTTSGNFAFNAPETAPADVAAADGWDLRLENARFSKLENGTPSIQVVMQVETVAGPGFEVWLTGPEGTVWRWSGGRTDRYNGVVCFQVRLAEDGEAFPLNPGTQYHLTIAFREPSEGVVMSRTVPISGRVPDLEGAVPGPESRVGSVLLGCPRSVI